MCGCERIWNGQVVDIKHEWTNSFGIRTYKVIFRNGKYAYFEISKKSEMHIKRGVVLFFSGTWVGPEDKKYYLIRKVYSEEEMQWLHEIEKKKEMMIMS